MGLQIAVVLIFRLSIVTVNNKLPALIGEDTLESAVVAKHHLMRLGVGKN